MKALKEISTSAGRFTLRFDGIIESRPDPSFLSKYTIKEAKEFVDAMKWLCADGSKPLLAHMGDNEIDGEARKYLMEHIYVSKTAVVGSSFIARMMANLLMNFVKPPIPMKMFSDKEDALKWLKSIDEHQELENKRHAF